ncbi:MAG: 4-methyl-5(b-hydroxyethyl)-thiazole monophosphate biosynthesis [Chlamydiales bacterium]|jgi:4-methyl-5(b-hydroxyethyl)-thiazole monophosphate biosynthesis
MTTKVLVPLAEGFEEIETVTIVDVLRRADLQVTLAGLGSGPILGSRGMRLHADVAWAAIDPAAFDAIVLPGGMGGTLNMIATESVLQAVRDFFEAGKLTAAICAAPMVLSAAGIVGEQPITAHPGVHDRLAGTQLQPRARVVRSGNLLTSQGPGTAMEFALALVEDLVGPDLARDLAAAMVVSPAV